MKDATLDLINAYELAKRLKVPPTTIWRWQREKIIPAIRLNRRTLLFDPSAVRSALEKYTVKAKAPKA